MAAALDRLGVLDRQQSFTELSFPDHRSLPRSVNVDEPLAFSFTVRNREGATTPYSWQVTITPVDADTRPFVVADGSIRLDDDEINVVTIDEAISVPVGPAEVSVVLDDRDEAIGFPITIEPSSVDPDASR